MRINYPFFLVSLLLVLSGFSLFGLDNNNCSISGKVYINHPETIFVYLVDEENSKKPFRGVLLQIVPNQNNVDTGYITFNFSNLAQGNYGIRCFQDLNNNGKLDRGLFGPVEPWGFSWNKPSPSNPPTFSDYCYWLSDDIKNIKIYLTE